MLDDHYVKPGAGMDGSTTRNVLVADLAGKGDQHKMDMNDQTLRA